MLVKTEDAPKPRTDSLTDPLEMKPSGSAMTTGSPEPGTSWPQNMEQISEFKRRSPFPEMASDDAEAALMKIEGGFTPRTDEGSEPRTEADGGQLSSGGLALEDDTSHGLTETSEGVRMEIQLDALSFVKIGIQGNIQDMTSQNFMQCSGQIKIFKGIHKFYLLTSSIDHLRMQVHIFLDHIVGFFCSPLKKYRHLPSYLLACSGPMLFIKGPDLYSWSEIAFIGSGSVFYSLILLMHYIQNIEKYGTDSSRNLFGC
jgi:hypothetical protein